MEDYYKILGLNSSATADEIRRAYRILARRYHPDVNPGHASEEKFKIIAEAYRTLSDPQQRSKYDGEFVKFEHRRSWDKYQAYTEQAQRQFRAASRVKQTAAAKEAFHQSAQKATTKKPPDAKIIAKDYLLKAKENLAAFVNSFSSLRSIRKQTLQKISIIEVSVSIKEALYGIRKTIEIIEPEGVRKVSVKIPPGTKTGYVLRLRNRSTKHEELVLVIRVAHHPVLSIQSRGLVAEVPVSIEEAILGANITVPSLDDQLVIKVPPGSQSGTEIRVKEKGVINKDGSRGDLFYRLMVKVPESADAVGIKDKVSELKLYYETPVRQALPKTLLAK